MIRESVGDGAKAFLFLATAIGTYVGLAAVGAKNYFWLIVVLAVGWVGLRRLASRLRRLASRARDRWRDGGRFARVLEAAGTWEAEAGRLRDRLSREEQRKEQAFYDGVEEGRQRVVGEILAAQSDCELTPIALILTGPDGAALQVTADCVGDLASVGSHWLAKVRGQRSPIATFQVVDIDGKRRAILSLRHVYDTGALGRLERHAESTSEFPRWAELERRVFVEIADLVEEN